MQTQEIRRSFLNYFKKNQHTALPSSPVLPHDDPTLLFTNAGMNQFKDVFLGESKRDYTRAATSQKCIRVGGKHNDLENVGHTSRHLTFFEMLGNFSFGDYFKKEAIRFAWEVSTEVFGFDPKRIWPTVFRDDDEAFELWQAYVPASRITRFGEKENFWAMGETGPCGPCSELLYDKGQGFGKAENPSQDTEGERFLEFWNLVFMQFNKDASGILKPLPRPSIDTGSGLERVVSLKMGVDSVFETDVLRGLIAEVENVTKVAYEQNSSKAPAFRVIADHLRCLSFAITDGVQPSNVDRGYVLRKILRRAVRYGRQLGQEEPFLAKLLDRLIALMGDDYPELGKARSRISEILTVEEEGFIRTLKRGGNILNAVIEKSLQNSKVISGDDAFKLKDTYGFPLEEIALIAKDGGLKVDEEKYRLLEEEAKERSRSAHKVTHQIAGENLFSEILEKQGPSLFTGYTEQEASAQIKAIVHDGALVDCLKEGQEGMLVLDKTPFYAEMGGQIGDKGSIYSDNTRFSVSNTLSPFKGVIAHVGKMGVGEIKVGDKVKAAIDFERRKAIQNNHTATHLLHWALHKVLGEHVKQAGSVVEPERLRFDFSHHKGLSPDEIRKIEELINEKIRTDHVVASYEVPYEQARKNDEIKQFFGEKYGHTVRVIDIDFSKELCGGTHTNALGTIGTFKIAKESSIAAGVRRIEAVTGGEAEKFSHANEELLNKIADLLKSQPAKILERLEKLQEENKNLGNEIKALKQKQLKGLAKELVMNKQLFGQVEAVVENTMLSMEELKELSEEIILSIPNGAAILASATSPEKCQIYVRIGDPLVAKGIKAQDLVKAIAPLIDGSGGGKPQAAQAGGKASHNLEKALTKAKEILKGV